MTFQFNGKEATCDEGMTIGAFLEGRGTSWNLLLRNGFFASVDEVLLVDDQVFALDKSTLPAEEVFFDIAAARHTPGVQKVLKEATVAIAGVGGLGSNIAIMLCRCGVGRLKLFDFDIVDPTNLNRQNYYLRHIGMKKVAALKEVLADINPYVEVDIHDVYLDGDNIPPLLEGCDVIVEAFDKAENKGLLVNTVLSSFEQVPIFCGSGMAGYGKSNDIMTRRMGSRVYLCGDLTSEAKPFNGLMAPRVAMVAAHQSNGVLRYLLGETEV